jgi:hypothetical protein
VAVTKKTPPEVLQKPPSKKAPLKKNRRGSRFYRRKKR